MAELTINGPTVAAGVHNTVLRDALFHSPVARALNTSDYVVIDVGIREGDYTSWIGSWDQSTQKIDAATPVSILDRDPERRGMRLRPGQSIVVKVTSTGTPTRLAGARVNFRLALVGGRDGTARPLVAGGGTRDPETRTELAALRRQINEGGLSEWEDPVALQDPVAQTAVGTFQGRLQRDSTTQISLQRYCGDAVEVAGETVSLTADGRTVTTTTGLLDSAGSVTASGVGASTLYSAYLGRSADLRLSTTSPTLVNGIYYLGSDSATSLWRFVGWVRTNASTQFVDDETDRLVVNFYNRLAKHLRLRPGYSDGNTATSYTTTSTTWTTANGGTGSVASYIANGEDALHAHAFGLAENTGANRTRIGIGDNSSTSASVESSMVGTTADNVACMYATVPATGYRTLTLLVAVAAGTGTYYADNARNGSAADPALTALYAVVQA